MATEHELHRDVAKRLREVLSPPIIWTTLDAGAGKMRGRTATQRKNRGVKPGWPDILVIAPGPNVLGIELKAKGGTHDANQIAVECAFHQCRAWYVLCRSVEEVDRALDYVLKRPSPSPQQERAA